MDSWLLEQKGSKRLVSQGYYSGATDTNLISFFFFELYDLNHRITGPVSLSQGKLILWGPFWEWTSVGTISALQRGYVKAAIGVASPHQFPPGALSPSACPRNPECL